MTSLQLMIKYSKLMPQKNKKSKTWKMENLKPINLNFYNKVFLILFSAYLILANIEKRSTYDKLNKDLFKKDKVIANLKKLTDTYFFS